MKSLRDADLERELSRRVSSHPLADSERDGVLAAIREERRPAVAARSNGLPRLAWATAGAAVIVLLVGIAALPLTGGWFTSPTTSPTADSSAAALASSDAADAVTPAPTTSVDPTPIVSLPATAAPGSDEALRERARNILERWDEAVAAAPDGSIVFTGFVSYGGGWRGPDADDQKSAFEAGRIEATVELSTETPPPGEVVWEDGSRATVPLISAAEAFDQLKGALADGACPECRPLEVIGARLKTRGAVTSRGWATVPAWEFLFVERDAPMIPITHVAVKERLTVRPIEDTGSSLGYAVGEPSSSSLIVSFSGSACGPEDFTAEAVESDLGMVVIVRPRRDPEPDATPRICRLLGVARTAVASLASPLGERTVLDLASGEPVPVYSEPPDGSRRP